jgi:hypothetical protein
LGLGTSWAECADCLDGCGWPADLERRSGEAVTAAQIQAMLRHPHQLVGPCDGCGTEAELWRHLVREDEYDGCRRCWLLEAEKAKRQGKAIEAQIHV